MSLRILILNYEYPPLGGGGGVATSDIATELAKRHCVTVVTSQFRGQPTEERRGRLTIHRVPVLCRYSLATASLPSLVSYWPSCVWVSRRLFKANNYDVINSHFVVPSGPAGEQLASRYLVPHVVSIHGGDIYDPTKILSPHRLPLVRAMVRGILRRADGIIAQSIDTSQNARALYGVDSEVTIVPLGLRPHSTDTARSGKGSRSDGPFKLVTVGRLIPRKNIQDLLRIISDLKGADVQLTVVGAGPERRRLEDLARKLGVSSRVRFKGQVSDEVKWKILSEGDAFVSTSVHEGFGLMFLEAMHCGLPIVSYNEGGHTEFLQPGRTGYIIDLGDRQRFADAIAKLCSSPDLLREIAANNRGIAEEYSIGRCGRGYEKVFDGVIERYHRNARSHAR